MRRGDPVRRSLPVVGRFALLCQLCLQVCLQAMAGDSLLMPLARDSLLLDIERADGRLVAVGERGHVLFSDDDGESWRQARVPTRQMLTAVHFPTAERGWAVGHDGLVLASIDGGANWALQRDGLRDQRDSDNRALEAVIAEQDRLKNELLSAVGRKRRERLQQRLEELALQREDLEYALGRPVFAPPLLDVFFADQLHGVAVGAFNTLLITDDGGVTWRAAGMGLSNPDGMHLNAVVGDGGDRFWIAAEGGLLFRSGDGGASWQRLESPSEATWFGIARSPNAGFLLAFGLRGQIYRSTDDGENWRPVVTGIERSVGGGAFLSDDYAVLVGAVGNLLFSDDGGMSFSAGSLERRVNLSAVAGAAGTIVAVGQGGIHRRAGLGESP